MAVSWSLDSTLGNTAAAARAESICDDGSSKNGEWHHIATISNRKSSARGGPWTQRFEELFKQVGMNLKDSANLVHIQGHEGPHSEQYHQTVFRRLYETLRECTSTNECKQAFTNELKRIADEVCTPGTELNKMLIKKTRSMNLRDTASPTISNSPKTLHARRQ